MGIDTHPLPIPKPSYDVNSDGSVNFDDVTALIAILLGRSAVVDTADINRDGLVTIADVTALVNIILGK